MPTSIYTHGFVVSPEIESELEASACAAAERQAANALQEHPEVISAGRGDQLPADALIQQSKDAEMLVVGSRGLGGFRG